MATEIKRYNGSTWDNVVLPQSSIENLSKDLKAITDTLGTTDSKNSEAKLYITGASAQGDNQSSFSNENVYMQNGMLYANSFSEDGVSLVQKYLSLSGGEMSGPITIASGDGNGLLFKDKTSNINIIDGNTRTLVGFLNDKFTLGYPAYPISIRGSSLDINGGSKAIIQSGGNAGFYLKGISATTDYAKLGTADANRVFFIQPGTQGTVTIGGDTTQPAIQGDKSAKLIVHGDIKENNEFLKNKYEAKTNIKIYTLNELGYNDSLYLGTTPGMETFNQIINSLRSVCPNFIIQDQLTDTKQPFLCSMIKTVIGCPDRSFTTNPLMLTILNDGYNAIFLVQYERKVYKIFIEADVIKTLEEMHSTNFTMLHRQFNNEQVYMPEVHVKRDNNGLILSVTKNQKAEINDLIKKGYTLYFTVYRLNSGIGWTDGSSSYIGSDNTRFAFDSISMSQTLSLNYFVNNYTNLSADPVAPGTETISFNDLSFLYGGIDDTDKELFKQRRLTSMERLKAYAKKDSNFIDLKFALIGYHNGKKIIGPMSAVYRLRLKESNVWTRDYLLHVNDFEICLK